jgi:arginyl-tRNA--protein-N-Asp/Glu arginylyltransferase
MILLLSETRSDYSRYLYPYVIWAAPEPGDRPSDFFRRGFLPASPQLDRYYLCRNLRVDLRRFKASSENRRILRKGQGIVSQLIPRANFDYSAARQKAWKAYADERFGEDIMSFARLDRLMQNPVISHLLLYTDTATGREVGTALLFLEPPQVTYYYYAFYDLAYLSRSLGMYMMTAAVESFARQGFAWFHLGTCYSERALYKTQFAGVQFFNGFHWSSNLDELKFLIRREQQPVTSHVLAEPDFGDTFYPGGIADLARCGQFRLADGPGALLEP